MEVDIRSLEEWEKKVACLSGSLWILTLFGVFCRPAVAGQDEKILSRLVSYVEETAASLGNCPVAIVVSRNGKVIFEKYSSGKTIRNRLDSMSETSFWPILSCTKSFVAAMLLSLANDKIITLDDRISKFLPAFETRGSGYYDRREDTVRHLASHTSGATLPSTKHVSPPAVPYLNDIRIDTKPGTLFSYSGLGMHILEKVIESVTGEDFAKTMQKRVISPLRFNPLGLYSPPLAA